MAVAFLLYLISQSGSGFLSAKEMPALLRALGWNPTETEVFTPSTTPIIIIVLLKQVNTIMAEVDVDHNGKMDLSEFILMMHKQVSSFFPFPSFK